MSQVSDQVAFLRARLDEDEQNLWLRLNQPHYETCDTFREIPYPCDCGLPERLLRAVEAKKRILDEVPYEAVIIGEYRAGLYRAIEHLVSEYSDHPEYREEWRP